MTGNNQKQYAAVDKYEAKLARVMERLGIDAKQYNWNRDRFGGWVEFRYRGELYRFEHSIAKGRARGMNLKWGSDAFAQIILSLEDLARMVERGIYDLQTWVAGMKCLPAPVEVPSFFRFMGFVEMPAGVEDVKERYRVLAKKMHPDVGGSEEDFVKLRDAAEKAVSYFEQGKGQEGRSEGRRGEGR